MTVLLDALSAFPLEAGLLDQLPSDADHPSGVAPSAMFALDAWAFAVPERMALPAAAALPCAVALPLNWTLPPADVDAGISADLALVRLAAVPVPARWLTLLVAHLLGGSARYRRDAVLSAVLSISSERGPAALPLLSPGE